MSENIIIRPLIPEDFLNWSVIWDANNQGHKDDAVTTATWSRLIDQDSPVRGLGAFEDHEIVGLVHYILHPVTGHLAPVCYMQDLFVTPSYRNMGFGRALVQEVARTGQREGWARMYWLAEARNEAAQALYKSLGIKLDFTLHVLPLGKIT